MAEPRSNCSTQLKFPCLLLQPIPLRRAFHACVLATIVTLVGTPGALAQDPPNLLHSGGFAADHNWFSPFDWEHFDAVTGNIMLTFTDLVLPGNAGRQLQIGRVFNSNHNGVARSQWQFGFPGMVMSITEKSDPPDNTYFHDDISSITYYTPIFFMADGAQHKTTYMSEPDGLPAAQLHSIPVISGQFLKYFRPPVGSQGMGTLYMPDGTVCHYAPAGNDFNGNPTYRLHDFSDPFGNMVTLSDGMDSD